VFQNLDQSASEKYKELSIFLGCELFLHHDNEDVQLLVACCLADIFRINAPDSPFQDPTNLKNIFIFLANQLKGLKENSSTSFKRYFYLLEVYLFKTLIFIYICFLC
jgi:sister chromatid cohesion protein PDS5